MVSDFDSSQGTLTINKARVGGIDKDSTKTGDDRRIELCPRALQVLNRQLTLRESLERAGEIDHDHLFFKETGEPIRNLQYAHSRWRRTLARIPGIQNRKPYCARHSSVSWNLMIGRSALWVARQHGHSIATMLRVYAAWTEGAIEADLDAIERAMAAAPGNRRVVPTLTSAPTKPRTVSSSSRSAARRKRERLPECDLALDLSLADICRQLSARSAKILLAGERDSNPHPDPLPQAGEGVEPGRSRSSRVGCDTIAAVRGNPRGSCHSISTTSANASRPP